MVDHIVEHIVDHIVDHIVVPNMTPITLIHLYIRAFDFEAPPSL